MKNLKLFLVVVTSVAALTACTQGGAGVDPAKTRAKADSLVTAQSTSIKDSFTQACAARLATEVKLKADSTIAAQKAAAKAALKTK